MDCETENDRHWYEEKFSRMHERLDEIFVLITEMRLASAEQHKHDDQITKLFLGNGKPALTVRIDRLEQAVPQELPVQIDRLRQSEQSKREKQAWWMSVAALAAAIALVLVEAAVGFFRK